MTIILILFLKNKNRRKILHKKLNTRVYCFVKSSDTGYGNLHETLRMAIEYFTKINLPPN